jgi:glycosyltransferase involved in cell wall biosynthesis
MARQRRHLMIVDNHFPDPRVEREAKALMARGFAVDVICAGEPGEPRRDHLDGIMVYRLPVRRRRGMGIAAQLVEYVTFAAWATAMAALLDGRRRYDSVQAHNVPDFLVFAAGVPKLRGAPVILDLHDLMPEFFAARFGGRVDSLPVRLVRWQEWASAGFADHVLTVTDLWRDELVRRGLPAGKVDVVMNLPDPEVFARRDPVVRPDAEPIVLVYHGTLTHRYGIDTLLRAVALLRDRIPIRLLLHGRGEFVPQAEALIAELQISDQVDMSVGVLPTAALPELIGQADIGVIPYRRDVFTDGILPTKLLEYTALGIPSVVARSRAVETYFSPEMVRFVEPDDPVGLAAAIGDLAADPELRRSLATRAQEFTDRYSWPDQAQRYADLVEGLIARKRRPNAPPS